ncbi:MAG: GatB/YqeY domain-containing protein [Bacteroidetes bacterium]|nr:GatB/YqeY domain-containing protein [Bacteroidota bacterium]
MSLEITINNDIKSAMLAKDKDKLEALRAVKAALLLIKTGKDTATTEIPAEVELQTLQKLIKQRKEAAEMYKSQNRKDLFDIEMFQVSIIEKYLPEQLSEEEIKTIIQQIITETGAIGMKDMGKVMGLAGKQLIGKADNKIVAAFVKELLAI